MDNPPNRIRAIRVLRGLSQQQLAHRLGISATRLSEWERGHRLPNVFWCLRLADALACQIQDLFPFIPDDLD